MRPLLALDFEYAESNEPHMGVVSVDFCTESGKQTGVWLLNDAAGKARAVKILTKAKDSHCLVSFNAVAEASCLIALGLNPRDFQWCDAMLEYRQLQNSNPAYMYGWHYEKDIFGKGWKLSYPPYSKADLEELDDTFGEDREKLMEKRKNDGRDHTLVTPSLAHAVKNILGVELDVERKSRTIDLILERKPSYSEEEKAIILDYGASDTEYLIPLAKEMMRLVHGRLNKARECSQEQLEQIVLWRGRAAANTAIYTMTGIPISRQRWSNLTGQKDAVIKSNIQEFQATRQNLWEFDPKEAKYKMKKTLCNEWVNDLIARYGMAWPKTKTGDYSMSTADGQPLESYRDSVPEIKDYCHLQELIKGLGSHATAEEAAARREAGKKVFADFLGSDDRVRPWYGPYGTQTARNAPGAVAFIFAQAGWLRGLIEPKEGYVILERDFSSQEAFIAAVLSGDPVLLSAYMSGDPYLAFAVSAGAAPKDATKASHTEIRNLFKSTVLGLQYGMGKKKLAIKLTADTGKKVSEDKADELIQLHKRVYHVYYAWKERIWDRFRSGKPICLADGWYLDTFSLSKLSTLNMPVQGGGSAIMRHMIDIMLDKGITVLCPVHDSVVAECRVEEKDAVDAAMGEAMLEACYRVLGQQGMRVGKAECLGHGGWWVTEKNAKSLAKNRKYLEFPKSEEASESFLQLFLK